MSVYIKNQLIRYGYPDCENINDEWNPGTANRGLLIDCSNIASNMLAYQKNMLDSYLPGPYTFILKKSPIVPRVVTAGLSHVGVRVPNNEIACRLANLFPITTTSANLSDENVLATPDEILNQLNCDVDLVIDVGPLESNKASTIVDLTTSQPTFIRR